jgi:transcriptional regulator with XRE-family HTH domain
MDYAKGITWARKTGGFTKRRLAELVGVDESHISMLESGKRKPSVDLLDRIARACSVKALDLFAQCETKAANERKARK